MPTEVPYTGVPGGSLYEREESIHENPTPEVRIGATPAAFGTDIAAAVGHLGEVEEGAGKEMFDRAYAMQELKVHADVNSRLADATNAMQDRLVAYKATEGKTAVDGLPTLQADLDKIRSDGSSGLSPYGQQLYDGESRNQRGRLGFSAATHAADQNKVYEVGSANASITTAIRDMSLDPNSTGVNIAKINTAVDHKSDIQGLPAGDPQRDMARRQAVDTAYQVQIHAMARDDPAAATKVYNAAVKSGALFSNDAMALDSVLKNAVANKYGRQSAEGSQSGTPPPTIQGATAPGPSFYTSRGASALDYKDLQPAFAAPLARIVEDAEKATGTQVAFTSLARTPEEQANLYYNYTHGIGGQGLAAPPGSSLHERGLAADLKDGPALDWIRTHAAEYGLAHLGMNDKGHIQIGGGLAPPVGAALPAGGSGFLNVLTTQESGNNPNIVSRTDVDSHGLKLSQGGNQDEISQGLYQIQNYPGGTWSTYAAKAGVDLEKYPTPRSAPPAVQWQVAQTIPLKEWGRATLDKLRLSGYQFDINKTLGENVAEHGGAPGGVGAGTSPVPTGEGGATVFQSIATPDDAADRPLADKTADALSRLNATLGAAGIPVTPEAQEATVKHVEALDSQQRRITEDTNRRDMQTVSGAIYGGGNDLRSPSTLGELRASDPKVAQALDRLIHSDPEKIPKIQEALNKNAKGDVPETNDRLARYANLKGMATTNPEGFAKQDILAADLPMNFKKELLDLQMKGAGKNPADENVATAFRQPGIANQLQTLGIDPKTEDYNLLAAEVGDEMRQFMVDNKRQPNAAEREEIVTRLLQDKTVIGGGRFGLWNSTEKAYKIQPPDDWMQNTRTLVQTQRGYIPTDMELIRAWNQAEYQKEYGGGTAVSKPDNSAALKKAGAISTSGVQ